MGHFGIALGHFGVTLDHFGVTLDHFGLTFGAKGANDQGGKGVRRPNGKPAAVQGGCKEGARRVQGVSKEGLSRGRREISSRNAPPQENLTLFSLIFEKCTLQGAVNRSNTLWAQGPANLW